MLTSASFNRTMSVASSNGKCWIGVCGTRNSCEGRRETRRIGRGIGYLSILGPFWSIVSTKSAPTHPSQVGGRWGLEVGAGGVQDEGLSERMSQLCSFVVRMQASCVPISELQQGEQHNMWNGCSEYGLTAGLWVLSHLTTDFC